MIGLMCALAFGLGVSFAEVEVAEAGHGRVITCAIKGGGSVRVGEMTV